MDALVDKIRQGDRRLLARAMSLVDTGGGEWDALADRLRRSTGQTPWWGFTGPPGVGKSTLIDTLLTMLRRRGRRIGVVAVDPTSPMSDGALLGDRVRMMRHAIDQDVFIRSLATRRREGGLSDATLHCARLLELANYDPVLIETVGVGQNEVDIASVADICVVVLGPGHGDHIQLIKAGLLEVADLVAVNKCDRPEANWLLNEVREELGLRSSASGSGHHGRIVEPRKTEEVREGILASAEEPAAESSETNEVREGIPASAEHAYPGYRTEGMPPEVVGVEAKSGKGVDQLLDKLLELDLAARGEGQRQRHRLRRVLGEIKRSAMLMYEQALDRELAAPAARELVTKLERGELSLQEVVAHQLSAIRKDNAHNKKPTPNTDN